MERSTEVTRTMQTHARSGDVWVLEWDGEKCTGVCGPLHYRDRVAPLADYHCHDADEDDCAWAEAQEWLPPLRTESGAGM